MDEEVMEPRKCVGCPRPLPPGSAKQRLWCSKACRQRASDRRRNRGSTGAARSRRALPDFAKDSGWRLRGDVERIERIFADDRFADNKPQVAAHLRGHLEYAAEVCQDLLSRIGPAGE